MEPFTLPADILLGSATSALQIEGGRLDNDWAAWCDAGRIRDGTTCGRAAGHWERWEQDVRLLAELGHEVYRMGLEWSRLEPAEGQFDEAAMAHYRREIDLLVRLGIRPLVTLHHFSIPRWFAEAGGFASDRAPELFESYVRFAVERIGDLVTDYITINEPNVYITNGYYRGIWPPGVRDLHLSMRVYAMLSRCHAAAYRTIHAVRAAKGHPGKTMAGAAFHVRVFEGASGGLVDRAAAVLMEHLFQGIAFKAMVDGVLLPPMGIGHVEAARSGQDRDRRLADFIALNYYTRSIVSARGFQDKVRPGSQQSDLGWEIYPEGLSILCRRFYDKYRLPVWITENGICDNSDSIRPRFLCEHLNQITMLRRDGVPVERYYHWSFLDNFEWLEGESARFGLVHVDFETQARSVKPSALLYRQIIAERGATGTMIRALDENE